LIFEGGEKIKQNLRKVLFSILLLFSLLAIISTANAGTLSQSNIPNTGGTLTLTAGETYTLTGVLSNGLNIDENITIESSSSSQNAIIDLEGNGRAFNITSNGNLTLKNITIINGKINVTSGGTSDASGGAIYNEGNVTLTGCTLANNTATATGVIFERSRGGAIFNRGNVSVSGCIFMGNTALYGSAIFSDTYINLDVSYSVFFNNSGDKTISISYFGYSVLKDNFYFWTNQDLNNLATLLSDLTSELGAVNGFYYLNISTNTVLSVGETINIKSFLVNNESRPISSDLPDLFITLWYNSLQVNSFSYKTETTTGISINSLANTIDLRYEGGIFYQMPVNLKVNTKIVVDPVTANVGETVKLIAKLTNHAGNPISGATVNFYWANGTLIGSNTTDSSGIAIIYYTLAEEFNAMFYVSYSGNTTFNGSKSGNSSLVSNSKPTSPQNPIPQPQNPIQPNNPKVKDQLKYNKLGIAIKSITGSSLNSKDYSPASWKALQVAIANARLIMSSKVNSQAKINKALNAIKVAKSQLTKRNTDLVITKVKRLGNSYKITIKNVGKDSSTKTRLLVTCGCKKFVKAAKVKAIGAGKSISLKVKFFKFSKTNSHNKYFIINPFKEAMETNFKNNLFKVPRFTW